MEYSCIWRETNIKILLKLFQSGVSEFTKLFPSLFVKEQQKPYKI